ncbi:hypothetical protein K438DRAFT_1752681 [Mycena galopus ATCC 62051]|nr:hypothetical protein K438DRAFT_1752681 [Mycena galopus ATCC 62051]
MAITYTNKSGPGQHRTTKSAAAPAVVDASHNKEKESVDEQEKAAARKTLKANNAVQKQASTPERSRWLGRPHHFFSTSAIDAATREYDENSETETEGKFGEDSDV